MQRGGVGQFDDLRGGMASKRGMVFLRGRWELIPQCTLCPFLIQPY